MLAVQRRSATVELLGRTHAVTVEHLAAHLHVSVSTVRRDLDSLEREGLVRRVHGGAVLTRAGADAPELPPAQREVTRAEDKRAIAAAAAALLVPGETVLVNGGTTTAALLPLLAGVAGLTVVTNSLEVAYRLARHRPDVILLGGVLRRPELSLLGHLVSVSIGEIHVDRAVMGVHGIDARSGALGAGAGESETDRTLAASADRLMILADASKFHRRSAHRIAPVERITQIVTRADAPAADLAVLRRRGVDVHIA